jgi:UDP-glucose 4-epimerase
MVILVTGGSGFIGSHVVDKLVEHGLDVRVFDKMKPATEGVDWFRGDLLNEEDTLEACIDIEAIFHLAAIADVNVGLQHPEACLMVNENGTLNLLRAAAAKEVDRVILASTTWVYGETKGLVDENTPIPMPNHIYTKTKIGQEHLVHAWHKHYGLPYTILRYDIPYGPRMRSNLVMAIFVHRIMTGKALTIFGDGMQGRCFVYVEDLAEGNVASLSENGKNQIFNLAGTEFVSINQIVENLRQVFGEIKVIHETERPEDFKGVKISIEKAEKSLGWKPKISFHRGLRKYIEYLQKMPQQSVNKDVYKKGV